MDSLQRTYITALKTPFQGGYFCQLVGLIMNEKTGISVVNRSVSVVKSTLVCSSPRQCNYFLYSSNLLTYTSRDGLTYMVTGPVIRVRMLHSYYGCRIRSSSNEIQIKQTFMTNKGPLTPGALYWLQPQSCVTVDPNQPIFKYRLDNLLRRERLCNNVTFRLHPVMANHLFLGWMQL